MSDDVYEPKPDVVEPNWLRFYFSGNQAWGWVGSRKDWEWLKSRYLRVAGYTLDSLLRARTGVPPDEFGLYPEYIGTRTLREHFSQHGIEP